MVYLANILGGTLLGERLGPSQLVLEAKAMRLRYCLKTGGEDIELSKTWLIHFLNQVKSMEKSLALETIQVPGRWGFKGGQERWEGWFKTCAEDRSNSTPFSFLFFFCHFLGRSRRIWRFPG